MRRALAAFAALSRLEGPSEAAPRDGHRVAATRHTEASRSVPVSETSCCQQRREDEEMTIATTTTTTTTTTPATTEPIITDYEEAQVQRANASKARPIVFVHGLWLLPSSWDRWVTLFEQAGYVALTPGWP